MSLGGWREAPSRDAADAHRASSGSGNVDRCHRRPRERRLDDGPPIRRTRAPVRNAQRPDLPPRASLRHERRVRQLRTPTARRSSGQMAAAHPIYCRRRRPRRRTPRPSRPSGVSPYMELFRNDTNGGTIDNYTTLVRPALTSRSMNQQFGSDISACTRNARLQDAALQQMNRATTRDSAGHGHAAVLHERRQLLSWLREWRLWAAAATAGYGDPHGRAAVPRQRTSCWQQSTRSRLMSDSVCGGRCSHCGRITSESMYFRSDLTTPLKCSRSTGLIR